MEKEQIAYAKKEMIPEMIDLWIEAFGDTREYVEFYFENRFLEENTMVYLIEGHPVSMISLLPAAMWLSEQKQSPVRYVYAVATLKKYRGRGYAQKLIETAKEWYHVPLILEPVSQELSQYYEKMGFEEFFYIAEADLKTEGIKQSQKHLLMTITPEEYKQIRDKKFGMAGYIEWNEAAVRYALLENDFCGGSAYKIVHDGKEDLFMYRVEENKMNIIETTLSDQDVYGVLEALKIVPEQIIIKRPSQNNEKDKTYGMLYLDEKEHSMESGYLNLTLD